MTPGSIVSFTVKLRVTPPGHTAQLVPNGAAPTDVSDGHVEEGEESTIEELIGRRTKGADGEEPTPLAHAPEFPLVRTPTSLSMLISVRRTASRHGIFSSGTTSSTGSLSRRKSSRISAPTTSARSGSASRRPRARDSTLSRRT